MVPSKVQRLGCRAHEDDAARVLPKRTNAGLVVETINDSGLLGLGAILICMLNRLFATARITTRGRLGGKAVLSTPEVLYLNVRAADERETNEDKGQHVERVAHAPRDGADSEPSVFATYAGTGLSHPEIVPRLGAYPRQIARLRPEMTFPGTNPLTARMDSRPIG